MTEPGDVSDPWGGMDPPPAATRLHMRRVPGTGSRDMAWALDVEGRRILALMHGADSTPQSKLPSFKGVSLIDVPGIDDTGRMALLIVLNATAQGDLFARLCRDIIDAVSAASGEREAVETFVERTWRWHRLLRGGGDGRLSAEEQKGLLAELHFLEAVLFPRLGPLSAFGCWTGPLDAPKDFEIGRHAVEVKARRPGAVPHVQISSEHQLEDHGLDSLHLVVTAVARAGADDPDAMTLADGVRRLRAQAMATDANGLELLDRLLIAAGFDEDDDYSDDRWLVGASECFHVRDGFPRVVPSFFPSGVGRVRYTVALPDCAPWRCDGEAMMETVFGTVFGTEAA